MWIFESWGGCWWCYGGFNFNDDLFYNMGVLWGVEFGDMGWYMVIGSDEDWGLFKIFILWFVVKIVFYMYDGSMVIFCEVVEFYNKGGGENLNFDLFMKLLEFNEGELDVLVVFFKVLLLEVFGLVKDDVRIDWGWVMLLMDFNNEFRWCFGFVCVCGSVD